MGKCKYCGLDAGFLSRSHKACRRLHEQGLTDCLAAIDAYLQGSTSISELTSHLATLKTNNYLTDAEVTSCGRQSLRHYAQTLPATVGGHDVCLVADLLPSLGLANPDAATSGELSTLGERLLHGILSSHFQDKLPMHELESPLQQLSQLIPLAPEKENEIALTVLNHAAQEFLADSIISDSEQAELDDYTAALHLSIDNLPQQFKGSDLERLRQATILRQLQRGEKPAPMDVTLPIMLGAKEYIIWVYRNVTMYQQKTVKQWVGGSAGVSIRVMKGVYYRTGGMKGTPVEHTTWQLMGVGALVLTNKNIIFQSPQRAAKIPFTKLIGVIPYSDGIELQKDGVNAKSQIFQGFDSWFIVNFLSLINT